MYCKNCGYENDADAKFCEECGANLSPTTDQKPSTGMSNTNKILIVAVIVLIAGIGIAAGILLTSKAPVANNSSNNTSVNVSNPVTTTPSPADTAGPKQIDSGSTKGENSLMDNGGPFTFEWKTYQNTENNLVIYSTYTTANKTVKQTGTMSINGLETVMISVEPKASGKSSYASQTTRQGYSTVVEYYWGYFRQNILMNGPIH